MTEPVTASFVDVEATFLRELVEQYLELVTAGAADDPAVARLTPAAYRDDDDASAEFAALTRDDLLGGRATEAERVLADLIAARSVDAAAEADVIVRIAPESQTAWMRTLNGLRLVLAARIGIVDDDGDDASDDARYGAYEWLGYRLELLVQSISG